ncbi:hypothetical protein FACS1894152_4090 [Bacilli bacterium]|nr:hypothetical protein FACS1894152_4090 [Bacilli bacterium]
MSEELIPSMEVPQQTLEGFVDEIVGLYNGTIERAVARNIDEVRVECRTKIRGNFAELLEVIFSLLDVTLDARFKVGDGQIGLTTDTHGCLYAFLYPLLRAGMVKFMNTKNPVIFFDPGAFYDPGDPDHKNKFRYTPDEVKTMKAQGGRGFDDLMGRLVPMSDIIVITPEISKYVHNGDFLDRGKQSEIKAHLMNYICWQCDIQSIPKPKLNMGNHEAFYFRGDNEGPKSNIVMALCNGGNTLFSCQSSNPIDDERIKAITVAVRYAVEKENLTFAHNIGNTVCAHTAFTEGALGKLTTLSAALNVAYEGKAAIDEGLRGRAHKMAVDFKHFSDIINGVDGVEKRGLALPEVGELVETLNKFLIIEHDIIKQREGRKKKSTKIAEGIDKAETDFIKVMDGAEAPGASETIWKRDDVYTRVVDFFTGSTKDKTLSGAKFLVGHDYDGDYHKVRMFLNNTVANFDRRVSSGYNLNSMDGTYENMGGASYAGLSIINVAEIAQGPALPTNGTNNIVEGDGISGRTNNVTGRLVEDVTTLQQRWDKAKQNYISFVVLRNQLPVLAPSSSLSLSSSPSLALPSFSSSSSSSSPAPRPSIPISSPPSSYALSPSPSSQPQFAAGTWTGMGIGGGGGGGGGGGDFSSYSTSQAQLPFPPYPSLPPPPLAQAGAGADSGASSLSHNLSPSSYASAEVGSEDRRGVSSSSSSFSSSCPSSYSSLTQPNPKPTDKEMGEKEGKEKEKDESVYDKKDKQVMKDGETAERLDRGLNRRSEKEKDGEKDREKEKEGDEEIPAHGSNIKKKKKKAVNEETMDEEIIEEKSRRRDTLKKELEEKEKSYEEKKGAGTALGSAFNYVLSFFGKKENRKNNEEEEEYAKKRQELDSLNAELTGLFPEGQSGKKKKKKKKKGKEKEKEKEREREVEEGEIGDDGGASDSGEKLENEIRELRERRRKIETQINASDGVDTKKGGEWFKKTTTVLGIEAENGKQLLESLIIQQGELEEEIDQKEEKLRREQERGRSGNILMDIEGAKKAFENELPSKELDGK